MSNSQKLKVTVTEADRQLVKALNENGANIGSETDLQLIAQHRSDSVAEATRPLVDLISALRDTLNQANVVLVMIPAKPKDDGWLRIFNEEYVKPALDKLNDVISRTESALSAHRARETKS